MPPEPVRATRQLVPSQLGPSKTTGLLGAGVDMQREDVGPCVVADRVEPAVLLLDGGDVEVGVDDLLALE